MTRGMTGNGTGMIDAFYQALAILHTIVGNLVDTSLLYMGNAWSGSSIWEDEAFWVSLGSGSS